MGLVNRLGGYLLLCSAFLFGYMDASAQPDPVNQLIQLVNQLRLSYGQPSYQIDPILMSVAQAQATWSAANNINSHLGPDGKTPDERAKSAGFGAGYNSFTIENVASGTLELHTPELVFSFWQGDYGHLNAMISPDYEFMGVGYAEGTEMSWYVMMVGWVDDGEVPAVAQEEATLEGSGFYPPFEVSTPDDSGGVYHEVQTGQSAWTIAEFYEIGLPELLTLNDLTEESILQPGDRLIIRPPAPQTNTPEPSPLLPTGTPPEAEILQITGTSPNLISSPEITGELTNSNREGPTPRPILMAVFIVIGIGVVILVAITIHANIQKL